jgi:hypothetical protein
MLIATRPATYSVWRHGVWLGGGWDGGPRLGGDGV